MFCGFSGRGWKHGTTRPILPKLGVMIVTFLLAGTPRWAGSAEFGESGAEETPATLSEVVVTAERRENQAQNVPIAVSAITGDTLDKTGFNDPGQLRFLAPGLGANGQSQTPSNADFSIRGVGTTSFSNAIEYNVSTVLDDIVLTRPEMGVVQYFDVAQVEVLRGTQITLFGKNASAGVVNIRTQRPVLDDFELKASAQGGWIETRNGAGTGRADGVINVPVTANSAFRVSVFGLDQGSLVDNPPPNNIDDGEREAGFKAKYLWKLDEHFHLYAIADYAREQGQGQHQYVARSINQGLLSGCTAAQSAAGGCKANTDLMNQFSVDGIVPSPENDRGTYIGISHTAVYTTDYDAGGAQAELGYDFDDGYSITGIFGYRHAALTNIQNGDAGLRQFGANLSLWVRDKQWTGEVRVASPVAGLVDWQGGIYLLSGDYVRNFLSYQNQNQPPPAGLDCYPSKTGCFLWRTGNGVNSDQKARSAAAFAELNLHATDQLTFIAGSRVTYDHIWHTNTTSNELSAIPAFVDGTLVQERAVTNFSYKLGSKYALSRNASAYLTYTRGYKGPAFNSTAAADQAVPINPEIPTDWEAGLKLTTPGRRLMLDVGAFYERIHAYQANTVVTTPDGLRTTLLFNAGLAHTRGFEAELTALPVHNLTLSGSVVFADNAFDSFVNSPCYPGQPAGTARGQCHNNVTDASGAPLDNAPRWTGTLQIQYDYDLTGYLRSYFSANGYYRSKANFSTNNNPYTQVPGYGTLDARVGLAANDGTWRVGLYVNNILDRRFASSIQSAPVQGLYLQTFSPNSFRGFGLQAQYNFSGRRGGTGSSGR
jgi:iron complex outermembrane receptor protein